jgi:RNA recognition motif-containing protein
MKIYVGNLPYNVTEDELQKVFAEYGAVASVTMIIDQYTGRSKGFGFIEMSKQSEAEQAIKALDGKEWKGRNLKVNLARPREERPKRRPRY